MDGVEEEVEPHQMNCQAAWIALAVKGFEEVREGAFGASAILTIAVI